MPKGKHILSGMPKGKHVFGTVKIGDKGQIVIPKEARQFYDIRPGDTVLVLGSGGASVTVRDTSYAVESLGLFPYIARPYISVGVFVLFG